MPIQNGIAFDRTLRRVSRAFKVVPDRRIARDMAVFFQHLGRQGEIQ